MTSKPPCSNTPNVQAVEASQPWFQGLRLLANKCDCDEGSEEEERPEYDDLISDVEEEVSNYCAEPCVWRVSMKGRKNRRPQALVEWEQVQCKLNFELVRRKRGRLQANLGMLGRCLWLLPSRLREASQQAADLQRLQGELEEARAHLTRLEGGEASFVESRVQEIRRTLEKDGICICRLC